MLTEKETSLNLQITRRNLTVMQRYLSLSHFPVWLIISGWANLWDCIGDVGCGRSPSRHFCQGAYWCWWGDLLWLLLPTWNRNPMGSSWGFKEGWFICLSSQSKETPIPLNGKLAWLGMYIINMHIFRLWIYTWQQLRIIFISRYASCFPTS